VAAGPLKFGAWLVPHWILAGFALGVTGAAVAPALVPSAARVASTAPARSAQRVAATSAPAPAAPPATVGLASSAAALSAAPRAAELSAPPAPPSAAASSATPATFDGELKLISLAKQALDEQHPAQALAWLEDHAQQFPNGVFAIERDALKVLARCEQGPKNESLAHACAAFHPGSPLIARLDRACANAAATSAPTAPVTGSSVDFSRLPNEPGAAGERTSKPSRGAKP